MKFVLVEAEIKQAIQEYVSKLITVAPGATIDIDVKATRGADGVTAEIDVALAPVSTVGTTNLAPVAPAAPQPRTADQANVAPVEPKAPAPAPAPAAPVAPQEPQAEVIGQAKAEPQEPQIPDDEAAPFEPQAGESTGKSIFG